jgi:hypothetical protein
MTTQPAPNVEERLSAAAFTILTDEHRHDRRALTWAVRYLRVAARGSRTAFQSRIAHHHRARARAFAQA